jgi:hypothetical protein
MEVCAIMRALDSEVKGTIWEAFEPLLPEREDTHPLGCHRARCPDRDCFEVKLVRLVAAWSTQ